MLRASPGKLVCDASAVVEPDLAVIDALARLALSARRRGIVLRVERSPRALVDLLDLCGLAALLSRRPAVTDARPARMRDGRSSVEAVGEPEQRKEPLGVEEERDAGDPIALDLEDLDRPRSPAATGSRLVLGEPGSATGLDRDEP
ncbi:MAG: hypothetical protein QOF49_1010 [Chloroflexota bacterium]|nr:hypothetical protein [Chloroflexota bacterium]